MYKGCTAVALDIRGLYTLYLLYIPFFIKYIKVYKQTRKHLPNGLVALKFFIRRFSKYPVQ